MLFNSYEFIFIFLPIVLLVYFSLPRQQSIKPATAFLILASLTFYCYWDLGNLPILVTSILFNYWIGAIIDKTIRNNRRSCFLFGGIALNLGTLIYFKYTAFIISSVNEVFQSSIIIPTILLPLGISFFTFTQIAYLVDVYRRETDGYSLLHYSLFVTIFPHLIAGPILYHKEMIPQFLNRQNFKLCQENLMIGLVLFSIGLFKKVAIADTLSPWVAEVFNTGVTPSFINSWVAVLAYTFQIYYDFSGYSDMAIGLGKMMNFSLPVNFNSPYKAKSIIDFWRRWHITLSNFLKNYLYIPLGGNRIGFYRRYINLVVVMLIGGLWHGAAWTFVFWGGLHGIYLVINHWWKNIGMELPTGVSWVLTFLSVIFAWVFFRSPSIDCALDIVAAMIGIHGIDLPIQVLFKVIGTQGISTISLTEKQQVLNLVSISYKLAFIAIILFFTLRTREPWEWVRQHEFSKSYMAVAIGVCLSLSVLCLTRPTEFLYFQF